ncbi:MAG TPA: divalent-cation tolerance protein CutA [Thermoanaerobaculia bacterium]|nr:divalent-cation tolerance protein CutA [Thermoanaerobaculia bacterium]
MRGDDIIVILTSVGTEEQGLDIAEALVHRRHAVCVNMVPSLRSIYRWKGKVCEDTEYLLVIKTIAKRFPDCAATIREINSYELPEILSFSIRNADARFCEWIVAGVEEKRRRKRAAAAPARAPKGARKPASKRRQRPAEIRK